MEACLLGIEIGGTKLQAALGTGDGEILELRQGRVNPGEGASGILHWFEETLPKLLKESTVPTAAVGVGFGGPVDSARGTVLTSHQVAGWEGVELKSWFEALVPGVPVVVANDSNAAGWAEYVLGAGRGTRHFFYMNIGSGIGGALIIDGKLHNGQGRGGGEAGHTYVADWTNPRPGASDKLEHLCSGWRIEGRIRRAKVLPGTPLWHACQGNVQALTCAMLADAARRGDSFAREEIGHVARSVGEALANVVTLFHPERIALGGGVSLMGDILLDPVREHARQLAFGPFQDSFEVVPCALGESVVVAGALLLASEAC